MKGLRYKGKKKHPSRTCFQIIVSLSLHALLEEAYPEILKIEMTEFLNHALGSCIVGDLSFIYRVSHEEGHRNFEP